jgi:hypothetical protein
MSDSESTQLNKVRLTYDGFDGIVDLVVSILLISCILTKS